jgi:hypothetical protein
MAKNDSNKRDTTGIIQEINEVVYRAIEQYKAENPDVDVDAILSGQNSQNELFSTMRQSSSRELEKFIALAKEQGTKMPFAAMETGVLFAGRKDMQNGLAEILNSLRFDKPTCSECGEEMDDRGRRKKKF